MRACSARPSSRRRRPRSSPADPDAYRHLAADYHWLYDDVGLRLGSSTPGVRAAIAALPSAGRVLDTACGLGVDAAALTRRGLRVTAADASGAMVAEARAWLSTIGLDSSIEVVRAGWTDLPLRFPAGWFDAVLCVGNSIAHCADRSAMVAALEAHRSVLAPGGVLILDTHDWEDRALHDDRIVVDPVVLRRGGRSCVRTYRWRRFGQPDRSWLLEIGLILIEDERAWLRSHVLELHPFTRTELRDRLVAAGFTAVAWDVIPGDDRYTVIARRPA